MSHRFPAAAVILALCASTAACKQPDQPLSQLVLAQTGSPQDFNPWALDVRDPEWLGKAADRSATCAGVFRGTAKVNRQFGHADTGADFDSHASTAATLAWFMAVTRKSASNQIANEAEERAYVDGVARDSESRFDARSAQQTPESALENGRSLDTCVHDLEWHWFMIGALRKVRDRDHGIATAYSEGI